MKRITGKIIATILTGVIISTTFMSADTVYAGELELVEVNEDAVNSENTSSPEYDESAVEEDTEAGETTKDEADEVYADNKGKTYKIKYVLKGGKNNSKNPKTYTGKKKIVLKAASKKGYSFKGWYKDKKYKKKLKVIKKGSKGNITAYAKWAANKYTIKYDANGGTGSMSPTTKCKYGSKIVLTANKFTRSGYSFAGWNTKKNGSGKNYADNSTVKNLTTKKNGTVTLYAQWSKEEETDDAVTYQTYETDTGVVVIVTNNHSEPIDLSLYVRYYKNGQLVLRTGGTNYYFESGWTNAIQGYNTDVEYDSYDIETVVFHDVRNMYGNVHNISYKPSIVENKLNVEVHNNGRQNDFTKVAVVYYKEGKVIGYDYQFASVKEPGSTDTIKFAFPHAKDRTIIVPDDYKVYVNFSYKFTNINTMDGDETDSEFVEADGEDANY